MAVHLILGATGGIGSVVTRRLAAQGHDLVIAARTEADLSTLAGETGAAAFTLDATNFAGVESVVQYAVEQHGRLDGIVNCVGSILLKPAHLTSEDEFAETIALNLNTAFFAVKAGAKAMQSNKDPKGGSIVLMSSVAAEYGLPNHEAIAAAKGGVSALARSAAASYAKRQIRVNAVAPGLVRTPLAGRLVASEQAEQASAKMHALGRIGEPEDVAGGAITFFCSTRSKDPAG